MRNARNKSLSDRIVDDQKDKRHRARRLFEGCNGGSSDGEDDIRRELRQFVCKCPHAIDIAA